MVPDLRSIASARASCSFVLLPLITNAGTMLPLAVREKPRIAFVPRDATYIVAPSSGAATPVGCGRPAGRYAPLPVCPAHAVRPAARRVIAGRVRRQKRDASMELSP